MKRRMTAVAAALAMGAATVATAAPAFAGVSGGSTAQSAQRACTYDVCMYSKANFKGHWEGYNHYKNHCVSYDNAFKIRSLKINSDQGTTFWTDGDCGGKAGANGKPSMSFKGHVKVKSYKFTARSSR